MYDFNKETNKSKKKQGFSLIELIVVIAIIGILTMLATPKFIGYVEKAKVGKIRNDVKVVTDKVEENFIRDNLEFSDWEGNEVKLLTLEGTAYGIKGKVEDKSSITDVFKEVPGFIIKEARSKLEGTFYANTGGRVYYIEEKNTNNGDSGNGDEFIQDKNIDSLSSLSWQKVGYSHFGYSSSNGSNIIDIYDNGETQIAVYGAKTPYMSYYNKATKKWALTDVAWWNHGEPGIMYAGDGLFMAKISGMANIISSYDGITWHNSGYAPGAKNGSPTCGAYDTITGNGVISFWYYKTPIYHSSDPLEERTEWTLYGEDGESVPIFKYMTTHKRKFVGIVGGDKKIAIANPSNPGLWSTTITENPDGTEYMYLKSVNGKLFVMKRRYEDGIYYVKLSTLNDTATGFIDTNLSHVGGLADNRIHSPQNIIWMEELGKFMLFNQEMLYLSDDGITWEGIEQPGLTTRDLVTFGGLIYTPGDGFYLSTNDGYTYYAPYELILE